MRVAVGGRDVSCPEDPKFTPIVQRFNDVKAPISMFAPIGNSPVMISKTALKKVVPLWHELAAGTRAPSNHTKDLVHAALYSP